MLIIQNHDKSITIPDDSVDGGSILFDFSPDVSYVSQIGLLDIDYETTINVFYDEKDNIDVIDVPLMGDNSVQTISIDKSNVKQLRVDFTGSGAVTFISFFLMSPPSSVPSRSPSESPSESPSAIPSSSPSESPTALPSASPSESLSMSPNVMRSVEPSVSPSERLPTQNPPTSEATVSPRHLMPALKLI